MIASRFLRAARTQNDFRFRGGRVLFVGEQCDDRLRSNNDSVGRTRCGCCAEGLIFGGNVVFILDVELSSRRSRLAIGRSL